MSDDDFIYFDLRPTGVRELVVKEARGMSETSDYAELLRDLDTIANYTPEEFAPTARNAAAAIRALEAKVREAEHWNESCEAENREHILSLREHAQRLEDDRDRLAVELFEAKAEIMRWQSYLDWLLKFASDQHDRHVAEVAGFREDAERWRWTFPEDAGSILERLHNVWREWDGCGTWNSAIDAARRAGEGEE